MSENPLLALPIDTTNPSPRCPVILVLDVSGSMAGKPIVELSAAVMQFCEEVRHDVVAARSLELCVVTFGSEAKVVLPFTCMKDMVGRCAPELEIEGATNLGAGLALAHSELAKRRKEYAAAGFSAYKPWVVLMTDGAPTDDWRSAADALKKENDSGRLLFWGIGIGAADFGTLAQILPMSRPPAKLQGLKFSEFFRWLTDSLRTVTTKSTPGSGQVTALPSTDPWRAITC